ncbi:DUF559 domain-containing protein [Rhodococcoides corynebacterioides]|uniref:DUF559 domain-containing protein n=1 Tax=Rhodococcoides corynebacterioides TaxID=53972 RepID=UPI001C9AE11F|nr:DUF559 domain-containing protein [Rhodococcus corynebacterioides]MBY6362721.1 DUF559 domain-containing protein [Rhodococcus corynebacterioides]
MGVVTRAQLIAGGLHQSTVHRRVANGTLHRLLPGVYSTEPADYRRRCDAVLLWKPDAVLSHDTAAWWWGLLDDEPPSVHATVPPTGTAGGPSWVRIHRRLLTDVRLLGETPLVSPEHAILDLATTLSRPDFQLVIDRASSLRIQWRALAALCDEAGGKAGMRVLREELRRACPGTLSEAERLLARTLSARSFRMEINGRVGPYYGDLVCRRARVIVEVDGREFHSAGAVFTNDRKRQNALVLDGWLVLRYSVATVPATPDAVADEIMAVVRRRRSLTRGRRRPGASSST